MIYSTLHSDVSFYGFGIGVPTVEVSVGAGRSKLGQEMQ